MKLTVAQKAAALVDVSGQKVLISGRMWDWSSEHLGHNDLFKKRKIRYLKRMQKNISEHFVEEIAIISTHYPSK